MCSIFVVCICCWFVNWNVFFFICAYHCICDYINVTTSCWVTPACHWCMSLFFHGNLFTCFLVFFWVYTFIPYTTNVTLNATLNRTLNVRTRTDSWSFNEWGWVVIAVDPCWPRCSACNHKTMAAVDGERGRGGKTNSCIFNMLMAIYLIMWFVEHICMMWYKCMICESYMCSLVLKHGRWRA